MNRKKKHPAQPVLIIGEEGSEMELRRKQLALAVLMLPAKFHIDSANPFVRQRLMWGLMTIPNRHRRAFLTCEYWRYREAANVDWTDAATIRRLHAAIFKKKIKEK
jgi:hypothetical protein